jgi:hypothetical protein
VRLYATQAWILVATAVGVLGVLLSLYAVRRFSFPLGADTPVYLWWARLASVDGLSAVGQRPGAPALMLVLSGTVGAPLTAVTGALEAVLAAVLGLAATALVRNRVGDWRWSWTLAGVLAGTFAVHLAVGYLASLTFAALFLASTAMLFDERGRDLVRTVAAACLLGAGGLAHPIFLGVGAGVLLLTALVVLVERRSVGVAQREAARIVSATLGGGAILGAGMLALLPGPASIDTITSKDGFLRRAGLEGRLAHLFRERFLQHWARYVEYISIPLAFVGMGEVEDDGLRRFFLSWFAVLVGGVAFCMATGLAPADRLVTFGFVIPILAGLGVVRAFAWLRDRSLALAWVGSVALVGAILAGSGMTWWRQKPYMSPPEVAAATTAGAVAGALPLGTPLIFVVDDADTTAAFLAPRAENIIRASMPPDRIADVHVYVGTSENLMRDRPTLRGDPEFDALSRTYLADVRSGETHATADPVVFVLQPFARPDFASVRGTGNRVGSSVVILNGADAVAGTPNGVPFETLRSSSPILTFATAGEMLVLLFVVGFGWARSSTRDPVHAFALAPAFGVASLILAGIGLERLGVPLTGGGPPAISIVAAGSGYTVWWWRRRNSLRRLREGQAVAQPPA